MTNEIKEISVDLIDDPAQPMRTDIDEEKIHELSISIKNVGLIQPITIRKVDDRFEVIAGHRRFRAVKMAGLSAINSIIVSADDTEADTMRIHENLFREDINPVDEAMYLGRLVQERKMPIEEVAKIAGKSENYIKARLEILEYPEYILAPLYVGKLNMTAAHWLNKIQKESLRRDYVKMAVMQGLSGARARYWFEQTNQQSPPQNPQDISDPTQDCGSEPEPLLDKCLLCQEKDSIENLSMYSIHPNCVARFREAMDNEVQGGGEK